MKNWLIGCACMLAASSGAAFMVFNTFPWRELCAGWALALVNAAAAFVINGKAVGARPETFLLLAAWGNVARIIVLLAMIFLYKWAERGAFYPFLVAVMTGFFVFLVVEIISLHSLSNTEKQNE